MLLILGTACSDGPSIEDAREVRELVAAARRLPRPELDDPDKFYSFENKIWLRGEGVLQFVWEDHLPVVNGEVNGVDVKAVPDTAAYGPMLFLDWVAARECGAYVPNFDRKKAVPDARGDYDWSIPGFVDHAMFGDLGLPEGGRIEIIEPGPYAIFGEENVPAESRGFVGIGLITTHMLFNWTSTWNLSAGTIRLERETTAPELPPGSGMVESRWEQGSKRVWLTVETRAKTFEVLLDSGSQLTILPLEVLPEDVKLDERDVFLEASGEESSATVLRKARLDVLRLGKFEILDFEIAVTPGNEDDPEPTLSAFDLREYGIIFLPQAHEVHLFVPER